MWGVCGYVWVCVACVVWGCVSCSDSMGSVFSRMILIILYIDCIYFGGHFRSKVNLGSDCLFFYSKMLWLDWRCLRDSQCYSTRVQTCCCCYLLQWCNKHFINQVDDISKAFLEKMLHANHPFFAIFCGCLDHLHSNTLVTLTLLM